MFKPIYMISFLTINYNGFSNTCDLIDSIINKVFSVDYEIIVVDNGSLNNEYDRLNLKYTDIKVVRSDKNLGFAGGNNLGIKFAVGDFIFFINNDTLIKKDNISDFLKIFEVSDSIGAISPKIKFAYEPMNLQFAGFTVLSSITLRNSQIGNNLPDNKIYDKKMEIPYVHGAAFVIKREVLAKVGLMPDMYFLYYEELDWSERIKDGGYTLWYNPILTIYHKESQSTGYNSPLQAYYLTRNRMVFAYRNLKNLNRYLSLSYLMFIATPKDLIKNLFKRKLNLVFSVLRGARDFVIHINKWK